MYHLPIDIIREIYRFDSTYHYTYNNVVKQVGKEYAKFISVKYWLNIDNLDDKCKIVYDIFQNGYYSIRNERDRKLFRYTLRVLDIPDFVECVERYKLKIDGLLCDRLFDILSVYDIYEGYYEGFVIDENEYNIYD